MEDILYRPACCRCPPSQAKPTQTLDLESLPQEPLLIAIFPIQGFLLSDGASHCACIDARIHIYIYIWKCIRHLSDTHTHVSRERERDIEHICIICKHIHTVSLSLSLCLCLFVCARIAARCFQVPAAIRFRPTESIEKIPDFTRASA